MAFGDILQVVTSAGDWDCGGDSSVVWTVTNTVLYERSVSDLSIVRSSYKGNTMTGCGGSSAKIWATNTITEKVIEYSVVDLSYVRQGSTPGSGSQGIGGDASVIWHYDIGNTKIYELSPTDFSIVRGPITKPTTGYSRIGGKSNKIWWSDAGPDKVYELSTVDFSVVQQASSPQNTPTGAGGSATKFWHSDNKSGSYKIYELDVGAIAGTVETYPATYILHDRAMLHGGVTDVGNTPVVEFGFDWGETDSYGNSETEEAEEDANFSGEFALLITGLDSSKTYHFRAKARDSTGWFYGDDETFTTTDPIPFVMTRPPTSVSEESATLNGNIVSTGGDETCDMRGFVWGQSSKATPGNVAPGYSGYSDYWDETGEFSAEAFSHVVDEITARAIYYFRAFARNSHGYKYGAEHVFLASQWVNLLTPVGDYNIGIRFDTLGAYPHPYSGPVPHYVLVGSADSTFTAGTFGYYGGYHIYEANWYNALMHTDYFTLANPTNREDSVIKVKWKARVFRNSYPYGKYQRLLSTHSTDYFSSETELSLGGHDVCEIFYDNPYTESAWTVAELDDLLAGISLGEGGSWGRPMCDYLMVLAFWRNAEARTDGASLIGGGQTRLNGFVVEDEYETCQVYFEWGPTAEYGNTTTPQTKGWNESFYADIDYAGFIHYRAVIETACGETFYGDDATFPTGSSLLILELAFGQSILTVSPEWTDVSEYLLELNTKRGRMHELDRMEAGTAVFVLDNGAGDWWRNNTAGTFYPDVKPLTLIRLRWSYINTHGVYYGVVESFKPGWAEGKGGFTPTMMLSCVDVFKSFTRYRVVDANPKFTAKAAAGQKVVYVDSTYGLVAGQSIKIYDNDNSEVNYIDSINHSTLAVTMLYNLSYKYSGSKGYLKKFPAILSGYRVRDLLLEAKWPLALTSLDPGQVTVAELSPGKGGDNIMEALYKTIEAEDGNLFVAVDGIVTFQDSIARTKSPYNTSQATFRDDDDDSKYILPELSDDDTYIYNEADISGAAIGEQIMLDEASQADQGPRAITRKDSVIQYSHDAAAQAFMLVERFKLSKFRCVALHLIPDASPTDLYPKVLGYDLSTRITLLLNSARNPAMLNEDYNIEGVEHSWRAFDNQLQTKWQLWDVNRYQKFNVLHDGYLYNRDWVSYVSCHNAAEAHYSPFNDHGTIRIGQRRTAEPAWDILRGLLEFDTSGLDAEASILEAYVLIYLEEVYSDDAWSLALVSNGGVEYPLEKADYATLHDQQASMGTLSMAAPPGWRVITLNSTGIAAISKGGTTRFGLRNSNDISGNEPSDPGGGTTNEYAVMSGIGASNAPKLIVRLL